jgi:hypothetical protein
MDVNVDQMLQQMKQTVAITSDGQVTILRDVGSTEEFIVTCLVAKQLAFRASKVPAETMSVDDLLSAGGMAQRIARQTVYNATSKLAQGRIIHKRGNQFYVDERIVLQYAAQKLSQAAAS